MEEFLSRKKRKVLNNVWLGTSVEDFRVSYRIDELRRCPAKVRFVSFEPLIGPIGEIDLSQIHWAIVGGESGPNARPIDAGWVDQIYEQCERRKVAFFFKQWGGVQKKKTGRTYKGKIWDGMPDCSAALAT